MKKTLSHYETTISELTSVFDQLGFTAHSEYPGDEILKKHLKSPACFVLQKILKKDTDSTLNENFIKKYYNYCESKKQYKITFRFGLICDPLVLAEVAKEEYKINDEIIIWF
jgi:hypothetical protein